MTAEPGLSVNGAAAGITDRARRDTSPQSARKGIALMVLTTALFVGQDATSRVLLRDYPAIEVTWARYLVHAIIAVIIVAWRSPSLFIARCPGLQILRSFLLLVTTLLAMAALSRLPFVDFTAIVWVTPVLVTALSFVILREKVGWPGWVSVCLGMTGVLFIARPAGGEFSLVLLLPLGAAFANALYQITTRKLNFVDAPMTTFLYTGIAGIIVCIPFLPSQGLWPDWHGAALMVLLGCIGGASHFLLIQAFAAAPAAVVSPFGYASLLWAMLFSLILFREVPGPSTLFGAALIVTGGLFLFVRGGAR